MLRPTPRLPTASVVDDVFAKLGLDDRERESVGEAFEDVTVGNSKTSCDNGFPATEGWDPVTGWGRPKWDGLIKYFGSAP